MLIRDETPADAAAIQAVIEAAFRDMPFSRQTEVFILPALRRAGALSLSLVAEEEGAVVGQAAFSPLTIDGRPSDWYGVGPVAILPGHQGHGIGSALMRAGLARMRERGAAGCMLVGHPDYYPRFGFRREPALTLPGVPPEVFMVLPFGDSVPTGTVAFDPAFEATG